MRHATSLLAVVATASLVSIGPARGEYWMDTAGSLLSAATHVEILRIDSVTSSGVSATVKTQIRGDKPGTKVHCMATFDALPTVGSDVLYICDSSECPRAIGIDQGGYFQLHAQQPGDGASVLPSIVERTSVAKLSLGKKAPDVCIDVDVDFLDSSGAAGSFRATFDPKDGTGTATGALFGSKQTRTATLSAPFSFSSGADAVAVTVHGDNRSVAFAGGALAQHNNGCYSLIAVPAHPVARTQHELETVLDTAGANRVIARGTIAVASGAKVAQGTYDVSFAVDENGQLEVSSSIMAGTELRITETDGNHTRVGFSHTTADMYPVISFDLGPPGALRPGIGISAQLATRLAAGNTSLDVTWNDPSNGHRHLSLGTATLTYVPAKK